MKSNRINIAILAFTPVFILIIANLLPQAWVQNALDDEGWLSILTLINIAVLFIGIIIFAVKLDTGSKRLLALSIAYSVLIYFLREADFHRLFTPEHVTRLKYYLNPQYPLIPKIISSVIFIIFFGAFGFMTLRGVPSIYKNVRTFEPWAMAVLFWLLFLFCSQLLDRSDFNDTINGRIVEESLEFFASLYALLSFLFFTRTKSSIQRNFSSIEVSSRGGQKKNNSVH